MQEMGPRPWRRPDGARGGAWGRHGPGSRRTRADADDDDDADDRTLRSRWIDRIRDRLIARQQWLDEALARLDALAESNGVRVSGAPFYTIGGLARGLDRTERDAGRQDADRQRAKEERDRRARERETRRDRQVSGRSERQRDAQARESRGRDGAADRDEADQDYHSEAGDQTSTTPADEGSSASGRRTPRRRSPASQTSNKSRGRDTSRRRS